MSTSLNTFDARAELTSGNSTYEIFRLDALEKPGVLDSRGASLTRLPYSLRVLLENLLRHEDGKSVKGDDIAFLANWDPKAEPSREIAYMPARVLMQDFTGVPAIVDLAAMRDAMKALGGDPEKINPLQPAELVIDHSVQVDEFGTRNAYDVNAMLEFQRNRERYAFLKWGQSAFRNFSAVPPGMGICHQVNLEYLARVVFTTTTPESGQRPQADSGRAQAYFDTLVGTDSHTTMINGLGVLGWGVGGIEAEAAMLGQPVSMLVPQVVGFKLHGKLREGTTATDLVLTVTEMLRKLGVVGKFVEFYGSGISELPLADRATIGNMAPEYGATCGIFPVDAETLRYLRLTGRPPEQIALVEAYYRAQNLFHTADAPEAEYSQTISLDLSTVEPSVAGPKRPQDRVPLSQTGASFQKQLPNLLGPAGNRSAARQVNRWEGEGGHMSDPEAVLPSASSIAAPEPGKHGHLSGHGNSNPEPLTSVRERFGVNVDQYLDHGSIVIAAITSCTNTSNPSVMLAAGLLAKKAAEKGLRTPPWVKTSLAPGSRVVTEYYLKAGLLPYLDQLRFNVVGYGCTTCIGNSGPLPTDVSQAIEDHGLVAVSVLSGNRNFEGRINSDVRANYLMSPPLVVAYALAGRIDHDFDNQPLGNGSDGQPVFLRDIWPTQAEVQEVVSSSIDSGMFAREYSTVTQGDSNWQNLHFPGGNTYGWEPDSTYIRRAPYFDNMPATPAPVEDIRDARVLAVLGDSVTTDHISPAGSIKASGPAGRYLMDHGVRPADFNSYGSRRGNHEVMVRGTFANVRLRNRLAPGTEGGVTRLLPEGAPTSIFEASVAYADRGVPLVILAGKEYGSGSSRDWAAKGPRLLGVRAVIAESYERIHRSNLVGMGILPLQFQPGESAESLGLTGEETYTISGLRDMLDNKFIDGRTITVRVTPASPHNGSTSHEDAAQPEVAAVIRDLHIKTTPEDNVSSIPAELVFASAGMGAAQPTVLSDQGLVATPDDDVDHSAGVVEPATRGSGATPSSTSASSSTAEPILAPEMIFTSSSLGAAQPTESATGSSATDPVTETSSGSSSRESASGSSAPSSHGSSAPSSHGSSGPSSHGSSAPSSPAGSSADSTSYAIPAAHMSEADPAADTTTDNNRIKEFQATVRIDTPQEILYYQHGGILQYVLRQLADKA